MSVIIFLYLLLFILLSILEIKRTKHGPDFFLFFILLIILEHLLPAISLISVKVFTGDVAIETDNFFINKIITQLSFRETSFVFLLLLLFIFSSYSSYFLFYYCSFKKLKIWKRPHSLSVSPFRWWVVILLAILSSLCLIYVLHGFANVIKFRSNPFNPNKSLLAATLFSFTRTFFYLSPIGILIYYNSNKKPLILSFFVMIFLSVMTVSRRPIAIGVVLISFAIFLYRKKINFKPFFALSLIMFPVLVAGKTFWWSLGNIGYVNLRFLYKRITDNLLNSFIVASGDVGRSTVESWATIIYLQDIPPRLGIDHLLSILRRVPDRIVGVDIQFPERMVRISTERFMGANWADIPPGFLGQMWLDWYWLGPIFCGLFYGGMLAFLQTLYDKTLTDLPGTYLLVLLFWTICMPLLSGTWDFVFSMEMVVLYLFCFFILRLKKTV